MALIKIPKSLPLTSELLAACTSYCCEYDICEHDCSEDGVCKAECPLDCIKDCSKDCNCDSYCSKDCSCDSYCSADCSCDVYTPTPTYYSILIVTFLDGDEYDRASGTFEEGSKKSISSWMTAIGVDSPEGDFDAAYIGSSAIKRTLSYSVTLNSDKQIAVYYISPTPVPTSSNIIIYTNKGWKPAKLIMYTNGKWKEVSPEINS